MTPFWQSGNFSGKTALKTCALLLAAACLMTGTLNQTTAEAKKKAAAAAVDPAAQAAEEMKKTLEPVSGDLIKLTMKVQGRGLFSPDDAGKLADIKYKLLDLLSQFPQSPEVAKPTFQAGMLFSQRESYNDAYEMFNYVAQGFPTSTYGIMAKGQIQQLEKRFGATYFAGDQISPAAATTANAAGSTPGAAGTTSTTAAAAPAGGAKK